jgi:hypothetical protein
VAMSWSAWSIEFFCEPNAANEPRANSRAVCESGDRREETSFEKVDTR